MIHTDLFQYTWDNTGKVVRSHRLQPAEWISIFCIITWEKESTVSILEDHILESLSSIEWSSDTLSSDFTYISENFNHFVQNIDEWDLTDLGVILWVLVDTELVFSHIWDTSIILVEKDGTINNLSNNNTDKVEFQSVSSGEVLRWTHVYLSSTPLENRLSDDLIRDLSSLNAIEWKSIIWDIFKKEIQETIHVGHIYNDVPPTIAPTGKRIKQLDILRTSSKEIISELNIIKWASKIKSAIEGIIYSKQKEFKYIFLLAWVIILFSLVYLLFSTISSVLSSPESDTKNQLLKAQELIENSQKIINNPQAFNKTITEAESILFELRTKRAHMTDTQNLLSRIEAMKKEVNDIQTIDLSKLNKIMSMENTQFQWIWVFEYDKKLWFIGESSAILEYSRSGIIPKDKTYPIWLVGKDFDITEDWTFYILTETNQVLSQRWTEITSVRTNWKTEWDNSRIIGTFNGNIYLTSPDKKGINRYKPGINWFSTPTTIISGLEDEVVDIWIDWWIYVLLKNWKIIRYIGWTNWNQKSLNINKVPGEYNLGSEEVTKLWIKANLSYVYVLSGKNLWIFAPDSKRFQDVTAWNYVAQLELQTPEDVRNIYVPRDGLIYVNTATAVYELVFEVADGKIILR